MDMTMKPGPPSLTQPREVRTTADSFAFTDSGSDSSLDGGVALSPTITQRPTTESSTRETHPSKKASKALRISNAAAAAAASTGVTNEQSPVAAAAAKDLPADSHPADTNLADTPGVTGNEASNGVTETVKTITATELNVLRAIEARYNALGAKLDEHHVQQLAWAEQKVREHRESGYGFGTMLFFLIIFLMIFSTYIEAEERRRSRWW